MLPSNLKKSPLHVGEDEVFKGYKNIKHEEQNNMPEMTLGKRLESIEDSISPIKKRTLHKNFNKMSVNDTSQTSFTLHDKS